MTNSDRLRELGSVPEPRRAGLERYQGTESEGAIEVLLIRHAHIPPSVAHDDPSLTEIGVEQAQVLAEYLVREKQIAAVYSSPLQRAVQTAEAIAKAQSLTVEQVSDLREIDINLPAGASLKDVLGEEAWLARRERMQRTRRWDDDDPYFEPAASIRARSLITIEGLIARHEAGQCIAIVTHGPVLNSYVAEVLGTQIDMVFAPRIAGISVVWARGETRILRTLNSLAPFGVI